MRPRGLRALALNLCNGYQRKAATTRWRRESLSSRLQWLKSNDILLYGGSSHYMPLHVIEKKITKSDLSEIAKERYGDLVKAVIDIERGIMAIGGELHSDEEEHLIDQGSRQQDLWGINLYPDKSGEEFIEFDSVINLRPSQGNRSRDVLDPTIRQKVKEIVTLLVEES